jgi:ADP-heptose:LPS heptosyltransferase
MTPHAHALVTRKPVLLMLRALGLGDFLAAVPAYRALARAFPDHHRVLAAPLSLAPLARLCGGIDEVIDTKPFEPLDRDVSDAAGVAVNLHGSGPQSHRLLLAAQPRRLVAFRNDAVRESCDGPQWDNDEHEVKRWCRLLRWFDVEACEDDLYLDSPAQLQRYAGTVVLHPGAASESRRWPVERWTQLARVLASEGWRVTLTGTGGEFRRCRLIAKGAGLPMTSVIAGKTGVVELCRIVAAAQIVICGDTGVGHLATALHTPSVLLFGPTAPGRWGPPPSPYHRVIWRGSVGDPHGNRIDEGLASITLEDVLGELRILSGMLYAS